MMILTNLLFFLIFVFGKFMATYGLPVEYDYNQEQQHSSRALHLNDNSHGTRNQNRNNEDTNKFYQNYVLMELNATKQMPNSRSVKNPQDAIIFPETCEFGFCTNTRDYPKKIINRILSENRSLAQYFSIIDQIDLANRFNSDEIPLCKTISRTIFPEKAKNTQKINKVIINVDGHKQGIVYETCQSTEKCQFDGMFPPTYTSHCKQRYQHKKLMVLEGENVVFDLFEVPSCCVCTLEKLH